MFKSFLNLILPYSKDSIYERINREDIFNKYSFLMSLSLFFMVVLILAILNIFRLGANVQPPETNVVDFTANTVQTIITVPFPQQSLKSVGWWFEDAIAQ